MTSNCGKREPHGAHGWIDHFDELEPYECAGIPLAHEETTAKHSGLILRLRGIWGDNEDQVRWHLYRTVRNEMIWASGDDDAGHKAGLQAVWNEAQATAASGIAELEVEMSGMVDQHKLIRVVAERDGALAVIEQAKTFQENEYHSHEPSGYCEGCDLSQQLAEILSTTNVDALAELRRAIAEKVWDEQQASKDPSRTNPYRAITATNGATR